MYIMMQMELSHVHGSVFDLKHLSGQMSMRAWLAKVLSELGRFTSGGECAKSLPLLLLSCILCWVTDLLFGVAAAVLCLSPSCYSSAESDSACDLAPRIAEEIEWVPRW